MGWLRARAGVGAATGDAALVVREERVRDWLREREAQRRREERAEGDRRRAARRAARGQLLAEARAARAEAREAEARERDKAERDRAAVQQLDDLLARREEQRRQRRIELLENRERREREHRELNQHVRYMFWAGWTPKQIAEHFGVSASRIRQRLAEATSPWERDLRRRYWTGRAVPPQISTTNPEAWAASAYEQYADVDTDA